MMRKINVVGTTATGKSTFARVLAQHLQVDYIEMDNLFWKDDWQESSNVEFFEKLEKAIENAKHGWVIDGNYSRTTSIKWQSVDTIIWLDYSFSVNLFRSVKRAITRIVTQQPLWENSNNRESFHRGFLSKDSIILWMIKHHHKNRQRYLSIMQDPQYQHIHFVWLKTPKQAQAFLSGIQTTT